MSWVLQLLKAVIRIEKKLDELLRLSLKASETKLGNLPTQLQPLSNPVQGACPLCQRQIAYKEVEMPEGKTIIRICGCEPQTNQLPGEPV